MKGKSGLHGRALRDESRRDLWCCDLCGGLFTFKNLQSHARHFNHWSWRSYFDLSSGIALKKKKRVHFHIETHSFLSQSLALFLPYLRVCDGKPSRHIDQVALFRVALYPQVAVILLLWWMRPVLVALGLQAYDTNCQIALELTRVSSHDAI